MPNNELYELLQQLTDKIKQLEGNKENYTTGLLKFTQKEISQMPKTFKKEFRLKGCVTHIRKRTDERYKCSYEIRYRRNGYNISVSATTIEKAKARFIEKLKYMEEQPEGTVTQIGLKQTVQTGDVKILTTIDNEGPQYYSAVIESINYHGDEEGKNFVLRITDEKLLEKTGGQQE